MKTNAKRPSMPPMISTTVLVTRLAKRQAQPGPINVELVETKT
jgi:hypothetical protein